ncbi:YcbK family protein [Pontitalea aquivivens]|uniref:YcbK family protein n=1 Tax=Pontitalea aquivivens TaxID=3388663 RepID=UPI0039705509
MAYDLSRRSAVFGIVAALGSYALPSPSEASPWDEVGYDRIWVKNAKGEELTIRHWDGVNYEPQAIRLLSWLWRDWRDEDAAVYIDPMLFTFLANIQTNLSMNAGAPCRIDMNSGYRTARRNATIEGAARNSYHITGRAGDFNLRSFPPDAVFRMASSLNVSGLGRYRTFTHVDTGATGRRWAGKGMKL